MSHGVEWVGVEWGGVAGVEAKEEASMLPDEDVEAAACDMADPELAESIALNVHTLVGWWVCVTHPTYHIPSYPILSCPIPSHPILSYPILPFPRSPSFPFLAFPFLSFPFHFSYSLHFLSFPFLSGPFLSHPHPRPPYQPQAGLIGIENAQNNEMLIGRGWRE